MLLPLSLTQDVKIQNLIILKAFLQDSQHWKGLKRVVKQINVISLMYMYSKGPGHSHGYWLIFVPVLPALIVHTKCSSYCFILQISGMENVDCIMNQWILQRRLVHSHNRKHPPSKIDAFLFVIQYPAEENKGWLLHTRIYSSVSTQ